MAKVIDDEVEYDSDPEEGERLLGLRRRHAASDDEEEERDGVESDGKHRVDRMAGIHSDGDSDGQGGAADYDDEEQELLEEEDGEEVYEAYEGGGEYEERNVNRGKTILKVNDVEGGKSENREDERENYEEYAQDGEEEAGDEEGKKVNEPFAVPTAGAFYMHDDRFRDSSGGRNRTFGGRKLWESRDDQRWGHDKFEEIAVQDRHYGQGRRPGRGAYRGRGGKYRNIDHDHNRRSRPPKPFDNGESHNEVRKGVKGRGPRKYEHMMRNINQTPPVASRQSVRFSEKSNSSSAKASQPMSKAVIGSAPPTRKYSSLSSSSPPFYPSGSASMDVHASQKRGLQAGNKNSVDSVGFEKLHIEEHIGSEKNSANAQMPSSDSTMISTMQSSRSQGRGVAASGSASYQPFPLANHVSRMSNSTHPQSTPITVLSRAQPYVQIPNQRSAGGSQTASPPKAGLPSISHESGDADANFESARSKNAIVAKGKGGIQPTGRGSFMYGGAQVVSSPGNIAAGRGDQNFPAFLPVMQFGGQHPGGIGVPAVGMAFPGYVAQPQLGLGNSEMTWLPVLTGAAGALGATYCNPYVAVDGTYNTRPSSQTSSLSSKEGSVNKINESKPSTRHEPGNDDQGQRQKTRRYSEMDFKQPSSST